MPTRRRKPRSAAQARMYAFNSLSRGQGWSSNRRGELLRAAAAESPEGTAEELFNIAMRMALGFSGRLEDVESNYGDEGSVDDDYVSAVNDEGDDDEGDDDEDDDDGDLSLRESVLALYDELDDYLPVASSEERDQLLAQTLKASGIKAGALLNDLGNVMSREKLIGIAQLGGIWDLLTPEQRGLFLENQGVLSSGKPYVSKRVRTVAAPVRKTMMQLSDGSRIEV